MLRRALTIVSLAAVAACSDSMTTVPPDSTQPSFAISDGARGGNPDFFFMPPMVANPSGSPNFNPNDFNPNLLPRIEVCAFASAVTTEAQAATATPDCHYHVFFGAPVNTALQLYQGAWTVPNSTDIFYRVKVLIGGVPEVSGVLLGFADVESVPNPSKLKTVDKTKFVGQQDGSSLPIKFRIEIGALCDPPGTRPCNSSTLDFNTGGTVNFSTDGSTTSGVTIPGGNDGQHTLTLQKCPSFNDPAHPEAAITDLPVFGSCVRIKSTEAVGTLTTPAIVEVCDLAGTTTSAGLASEAQEHRITLHRLDGTTLRALPHVPGCAVFTGQTTPTVGSVLAELAHGHFRAAGGKFLAMLAPTPLNARRRRIDEGGGGQTGDFSDFQFALPAKLSIDAGYGQSGVVGSPLPVQPRVKVTDLGGELVKGVTIKFQGDGVAATSLTTDATGVLSIPWTIPLWVTNTLTASGRGVGGNDNNGPRCGVDPFEPIQGSPHPAEFGPAAVCGAGESNGTAETPVILSTGSVVFKAYGAEGFETSTAAAWTNSGFWHRSTVSTSLINQAFTDGLVSLAPGDASAGHMPGPFAGSWSAWYGTEPGVGVGTENGNYIGTRSANNAFNSQSGGQSTAVNSGTLTSPSFVVPTGGLLSFRTWWEIESAAPNAFDKMTVSVLPSGGLPVLLGQLNPTSDPDGNINTPPNLPFTSTGNNLAPTWVQVTKDLSAYAGQTVQLLFDFNTGDVNFNGFRGWLLDNIVVAPPASSPFPAALISAGTTLNPPSAPGQPRRP